MTGLAAYIAASVALIVKPGPDALFALAVSVERGRRAGVAAVAGLVTGCFIWVSLLSAGVAAFFTAHPQVLAGIRVCGVVYILYLAVASMRQGWREIKGGPDVPPAVREAAKMMMEAQDPDAAACGRDAECARPPEPPAARGGARSLWLRGVAMSMSNPLTIMFFLSFLPEFVKADAGVSPAVQTFVLGSLFCALAPAILVPEVLAAGWLGEYFARDPRRMPRLKIFSGSILLAVAFFLAVA